MPILVRKNRQLRGKVISLGVLLALLFTWLQTNVAKANPVDETGDFVTQDQTIYGLTAAGLKKLQLNGGELVLPTHSPSGQPLTQVASFAFTPRKSVAIEEYTGRTGADGRVDDLDVDGNQIKAWGVDFSSTSLKKLTIPEGYQKIGQDAFAFNKSLAQVNLPASLTQISDYAFAHGALPSLKLPAQLQTLKDQVFFDNKLAGVLDLPAGLQQLGERVFKGNRLTDIKFNQAPLTELKEAVFEDNQLTSLNIPATITKIAPDAFGANPGDKNYGNAVVLKTPGGKNPAHLPSQGNYLVDPTEEKRTTPIELDTSQWEADDFTYADQTITGFSAQGELKVKENKHLVLPSQYQGKAIKKIGDNAFRNVDLTGKTLKKYDLETVELPAELEEIGAFAFQSNRLTELLLDPEAPLRVIGPGAFMNNQLETLVLPTGLQGIEDAAFHINELTMVLIPRETVFLGRSAFRQNNLQYGLGFETGAKLEKIDEMAFAESNLTSVDFENAQQLKEISVQAFAGNDLSDLTLPENLTTIGAEAFRANHLRTVPAGAKLTQILFNAFDNNPGEESVGQKVLITLPASVTQTELADGDNFVIDPRLETKARGRIAELVKELSVGRKGQLWTETDALLADLISEGQKLAQSAKLSQGTANGFIFRAEFFRSRLDLDRALLQAEQALSASDVSSNLKPAEVAERKKLLAEKVEYARTHFNNAAWSAEKLARITQELKLLTDLRLGRGAMGRARMVQGVHELHTTLPIPNYFIGVNVYFDDQGKVIYVLDRSYTIGAGQKDEYGNQIENVDEDNQGYHELALETLPDYAGKSARDLLSKQVDTIGGIRAVPLAEQHRAGLYRAVQDAARDYLRLVESETGQPEQPGQPGQPEQPSKPKQPGKPGQPGSDTGLVTRPKPNPQPGEKLSKLHPDPKKTKSGKGQAQAGRGTGKWPVSSEQSRKQTTGANQARTGQNPSELAVTGPASTQLLAGLAWGGLLAGLGLILVRRRQQR